MLQTTVHYIFKAIGWLVTVLSIFFYTKSSFDTGVWFMYANVSINEHFVKGFDQTKLINLLNSPDNS